MKDSFERAILRTQYAGPNWQKIVDRLSESRVDALYRVYIAEMHSLYLKLIKESK